MTCCVRVQPPASLHRFQSRWRGLIGQFLTVLMMFGLATWYSQAAARGATDAQSATGTAGRAAAAVSRGKPASPQVMKILGMLYHRGGTLKNFTANLRVTIKHLRSGETDINLGKIWYENKKGHTRFDIHFSILAVDGAIARHHADHDIIFDGRWLIDRDGSAKIYRKIEIAPPGTHFNPLKLGQGPIPIPIGQRPATVLREFHVRLLKPVKTQPHLVVLKLIPRDPKAFTFLSLTFWINTELQLPISIRRVDPDGTPTLAAFSKIKINAAMHHSFHVSPPPSNAGWTISIQRARKEPGKANR